MIVICESDTVLKLLKTCSIVYQARSQVLSFGGKYIFKGKDFC